MFEPCVFPLEGGLVLGVSHGLLCLAFHKGFQRYLGYLRRTDIVLALLLANSAHHAQVEQLFGICLIAPRESKRFLAD